jgi:transcriptional regulator with PAS, ATPase and Fis domain
LYFKDNNMKMLPVNMSSIPVFSPSSANAATNKTQTAEGQASQVVFSSKDAPQPLSSREQQEKALLQVANFTQEVDPYIELARVAMEKAWARQDNAALAYTMMEKGVQEVMETIALEMPKIFTKDFDFTRTAEGIEIVDHELTTEEYNYVKYVANNNQNLLDGADKFNQSVADAKTYSWYLSKNQSRDLKDEPVYKKDAIEGRINIKAYMEDLSQFIWELGSSSPELRNDKAYAFNYMSRGIISVKPDMVDTVYAEVSTKV